MSTREGHTRRPREIEADLERTRAEMGHTLDKLQHKFSPGELFDQGLNYVRANGGGEIATNLRDTIARNPLPVALIGLGFAWLMMSGRRGSVAGDYATQSRTDEGSEDAAPPTLEAGGLDDSSTNDKSAFTVYSGGTSSVSGRNAGVAEASDEASPHTYPAESTKSSRDAKPDDVRSQERVI